MEKALQDGFTDAIKEEMMKVLITSQEMGLYDSELVANYVRML